MASRNFLYLADNLAKANIDFDTGAFKALLLDNGAEPTDTELDTWVDRADVDTASREHAATGGYAQGGFGCDSVVAIDAANNKVTVTITPTSANPQYTSSTINSIGAIIYLSTGAAANDLLVGYVYFGGIISSDNGDFNVTFTDPLDISV